MPRFRCPVLSEQDVLDRVQVRLLTTDDLAEREKFRLLMTGHQRFDVSCREDASRVRNPNALLVLGILRRAADGVYMRWRRGCRNKRQSRVKDFHVAMGRFNQRAAFKMITKGYRNPTVQKSAMDKLPHSTGILAQSWGLNVPREWALIRDYSIAFKGGVF